jgi:predicted nucleic acid-binding protein
MPMEPPTSLTKPETITTDASTVINLNATGCARDIVQALGHKFVVVDIVQAELETGRQSGRRDADLLNALLADQLFELVQLDGDAMAHFESLVIGPAISTLDDGEAATIAYSMTTGATAAIDERKATSICAERFPLLSVCSTVDILARPDVQKAFGKDELSVAVFRALTHGRMRVLPHNVQWVVDLIGPEQASTCTSLPRIARRLRTN